MATDRVILIGGGGHARVVFDAIIADGASPDAITVRDAWSGKASSMFTAVAPEIDGTLDGSQFHVAIGSAEARCRLSAAANTAGGRPRTVIHPRATVSPYATIGRGAFIAAGAVIGPGAVVGDGVIINHGAVVDHDCVVEEYAHIAPHATLGGASQIGGRALIGAGAVVLPGVEVGNDTLVGAGTIVSRAINGGTWIGAPARHMKDIKNNGAD